VGTPRKEPRSRIPHGSHHGHADLDVTLDRRLFKSRGELHRQDAGRGTSVRRSLVGGAQPCVGPCGRDAGHSRRPERGRPRNGGMLTWSKYVVAAVWHAVELTRSGASGEGDGTCTDNTPHPPSLPNKADRRSLTIFLAHSSNNTDGASDASDDPAGSPTLYW